MIEKAMQGKVAKKTLAIKAVARLNPQSLGLTLQRPSMANNDATIARDQRNFEYYRVKACQTNWNGKRVLLFTFINQTAEKVKFSIMQEETMKIHGSMKKYVSEMSELINYIDPNDAIRTAIVEMYSQSYIHYIKLYQNQYFFAQMSDELTEQQTEFNLKEAITLIVEILISRSLESGLQVKMEHGTPEEVSFNLKKLQLILISILDLILKDPQNELVFFRIKCLGMNTENQFMIAFLITSKKTPMINEPMLTKIAQYSTLKNKNFVELKDLMMKYGFCLFLASHFIHQCGGQMRVFNVPPNGQSVAAQSSFDSQQDEIQISITLPFEMRDMHKKMKVVKEIDLIQGEKLGEQEYKFKNQHRDKYSAIRNQQQ